MKDITVKGLPDGINEQDFLKWTAIFVDRYLAADIEALPEVIAAKLSFKTSSDAFKDSNNIVIGKGK